MVRVMPKQENGLIYLIHFEKPYKHARHYLGWTHEQSLPERLNRHRRGDGAKLLKAAKEAGIRFKVVRTWEGTRDDERSLKRLKQTPKLCPVCSPKTFRKTFLDKPSGK